MSGNGKRERNRLCSDKFDTYVLDRVLVILGTVLFLCAFFSYHFIGDENLADIFGAFGLAAWYLLALQFLFKLSSGYRIFGDGILFHYRFLRHKLLYQDIKCIIVVNAQVNLRITSTPYVVLIGGEEDRILQYCMTAPKRHVLSEMDIRYTLGAEIGCYHPDNIRYYFKKGSATIHDYGFWWNRREIHKLLAGYPGDYYIAASVLEHNRDKFDEIVKKYEIGSERIHFIDDSLGGKFVWR